MLTHQHAQTEKQGHPRYTDEIVSCMRYRMYFLGMNIQQTTYIKPHISVELQNTGFETYFDGLYRVSCIELCDIHK